MGKLNVLAITACISGVAHTYMAAERLEKLASQENWQIKVETQGALGIENPFTDEEIKAADVVIIISNTNVKKQERYEGCRRLKMDISQFLIRPEAITTNLKKVLNAPKGTCLQVV
ncbi:fructose PTS transporter subunit IIB [Zophobihabitans entericus]|uniref:protein-N(pi)-phosphohistidine--D-fructose phosphotransferase n=1 Tax=Zophobihabitans entericus TaxID=1635327 RepID=A0A6G9I9N8_9GAMM|nr:fructose PTS transporter subunit IIB [Zophobihabitans entericus]QIQ20444.1 PTS fructose-like transporter subunit EIIB [Zophobihabitans entericus]